jgi:DNA sulfur modification protein DndD
MRFKSIAIENLFSYHGKISFDFNNDKQPITLIIGENGFGKTSFINSIKLALHGISKDLLQIGAQSLTKSEFVQGSKDKNFSGMLNRNAKATGHTTAKVIIEIDDGDIFIVERAFKIDEKGYTETLFLRDEDGSIFAQDSEAQDIINSKLSPTMAQFFFFDGEKVQTIADFSHEEFTKMLEDVLELDIYDQMIKDSESIIRKITKNELDNNLQEEVEAKFTKLTDLSQEIEEKKEKLKYEQKTVLRELNTALKQVESKLGKLKSKFTHAIANAKEQHTKLLEEKKDLTDILKQATFVQLPLLLNQTLAQKVSHDIDKNYRGKIQIDTDLLAQKKSALLALLGSEDTKVSAAFDKVFSAASEKQSVLFADPYRIEKQYDLLSKIKIELPKLLKSLSGNRLAIIAITKELHGLEEQQTNELKDAESDRIKERELLKNIGHQEAICEALEIQIIELTEAHKTLKSEYDRLTIVEHQHELTQKKIGTLHSVINVARQMKSKIKKDKRLSLEKTINEKFSKLRKDGYEANHIRLDEDFNINIYDKDNRAMDILSSSSGQKQIIATALIWGISEYIPEEIPMVIDTPLGRLDENNQTRILNEFYPNASNQVIILPTPSELRHESFQRLKEHIEQVYILSNAGSATTITEASIENITLSKEQQKNQGLVK